MSFESTRSVLHTIRSYSKQLVALYEAYRAETDHDEVRSSLDQAIQREVRFQMGLTDYESEMSSRVGAAQFKWHDRRQLWKAIEEMQEKPVDDTEQVIELVTGCDQALADYCSALKASTNSQEVLDFIDSLRTLRLQDRREMVWQALRSEAESRPLE